MSEGCQVPDCKYCREAERMSAKPAEAALGPSYFNAFGENVRDDKRNVITSKIDGPGRNLSYEMLEAYDRKLRREAVEAVFGKGQFISSRTMTFPFGFTDSRAELKKKEPSPHCNVCWDAKAREEQVEVQKLRTALADARGALTFVVCKFFGHVNGEEVYCKHETCGAGAEMRDKWGREIRNSPNNPLLTWKYRESAYHQALNDPAQTLGVPDPNAPKFDVFTELEKKRVAYEMEQEARRAAAMGAEYARAKAPAADVSGSGPDGVKRVCRKSLPGHPVEMNEDEKKCWKCGGEEFEG